MTIRTLSHQTFMDTDSRPLAKFMMRNCNEFLERIGGNQLGLSPRNPQREPRAPPRRYDGPALSIGNRHSAAVAAFQQRPAQSFDKNRITHP
jgi:hypothetical protein